MNANNTALMQNAGNDSCSHCGTPHYEEGYKIKLCGACRRTLSRYPVKKTVLWAAVGVGILFLLSLYKFPRSFSAVLSYERAVKLAEQRKYMSAEKELRKTLQQFPEYLEASAHFMIAAYYNDHLAAADSALQHWSGASSTENDKLIAKVNDVLSGMSYYHFEDSNFAEVRYQLRGDAVAYQTALLQYSQQHPDDMLATYFIADLHFEQKNYSVTDSLCEQLLAAAPDFHPVYILLAAAYREEMQYDKALAMCNKLLQLNAESIDAQTAVARILLKQKLDKQALAKALDAYALEPSNAGAIQTLTLAYHFNHQTKERDQLLAMLKQNADTSGLGQTEGVIQGKIAYRN